MRRMFFDMDGVLAYFEKDASLEEMTSPGFFLSRIADPKAITLLKGIMELQEKENIEVYILSSYLLPISKEEKIKWNEMHTGVPLDHQIYVPYGTPKAECLKEIGGIRPDDVLIDDFTHNLKEWPGVGVKYYNGINGTKGTWDGYSISRQMDYKVMINQLDGISMICSTRQKMMEAEQVKSHGR